MRFSSTFLALSLLTLAPSSFAQDASAKVRVTDDRIEVLEPISFNSGQAVILPASNAVLDELAGVVKAQGDRVAGIRIEGHTDNTGDSVLNAKLSDARAHAVENALVARGIDAGRIVARGFGPKRPIADNATPEGRSQNRRVEIFILSKDELAFAKDSSLGRLTSVTGLVELSTGDGFAKVGEGTPLLPGNTIRLGRMATADVTLKDDTRLHLADGALFTLNTPKDKAKYNADGTLEKGSLWITLSELSLGRMFVVNTKSASADIDIGEKQIKVVDDTTSFANFDGRPMWLWPANRSGRPTQVALGKGGSFAVGARPVVSALPPAPQLSPIGASKVAARGLPFASWSPVSGAKAIHVTFAAGSAGLGRLTEIQLPGDATSIDGSFVPGGYQWVSLQSENDAGMMSPLSARQKVAVIKVQSDSRFAEGEGSTVSAGTKLSFASPTLCSVDGGQPLAQLVLDKVGLRTITCTGPHSVGFAPWKVNVAAIELVSVPQTPYSPLKAKDRRDFKISSTAPVGTGLRFVVDGAYQYDGLESIPGKPLEAWASFVPDASASLPGVVRLVRNGKTVATAAVK